jgi:hypothetical protein
MREAAGNLQRALSMTEKSFFSSKGGSNLFSVWLAGEICLHQAIGG